MSTFLNQVRLYWGDLWAPGRPMEGQEGEPKHNARVLIERDSENLKKIQAAFISAAQGEFGPNWQQIIQAMEESKKCVRNGDKILRKDGSLNPEFVSKFLFVATNKARPAVVAARKFGPGPNDFYHVDASGRAFAVNAKTGLMEEVKQPVFQVKAPYNGCYVNLKVNIKAMKAKGRIPNNVFATLEAVQFHSDGEAFGAGPGSAEGFDSMGDIPSEETFGTAGVSAEDLFGGASSSAAALSTDALFG